MRLVTLITDFGTSDTYVAQMKAVLYSLCTDCTIVDVTHEIPAQNIYAGARALRETALLFPKGTIHIAVVDPGVGTQRRLIGAKLQGHFFVMPDNGLLSLLSNDFPLEMVIQLTERKFWSDSVSKTFHGRDIIAPVAAHLANGTQLEEMGAPISVIAKLNAPTWTVTSDCAIGEVVDIDHYGNVVTNLPGSLFVEFPSNPAVRTQINGQVLEWRWCASYGFSLPNAPVALIGSHGHLELAVNCGSAAAEFALKVGDAVTLYF